MAEEKKRNGEFWALALECAHLGVWDWDILSGDCFYSPTWSHMLGYEDGELANSSDLWLKLTHPDDRERALASGERHIAGLTTSIETELRLKHKDGHWIWVLDRGGIVERDATGKPVRLMGVQTDISRQKEAEAELERVNVRFRLALAASASRKRTLTFSSSTSAAFCLEMSVCTPISLTGLPEASRSTMPPRSSTHTQWPCLCFSLSSVSIDGVKPAMWASPLASARSRSSGCVSCSQRSAVSASSPSS